MTERRKIYEARDDIRRTLISDDETPNTFHVKLEMDVEPILDSIHRDRELMSHGVNKLVARIPIFIYERAVHEEWDEDDWKRWLNSDEATPWRIWKGRV